MSEIMVWTYGVYLVLGLGLTVFVARTLHKNGRVFLIESFHGDEKLADSVNHLLVVGFYLINIGFVSLALKYGEPARTVREAIEYLSWKVGFVAILLGVVHLINLRIFTNMRTEARTQTDSRKRWESVPDLQPADARHRR